MGTTMTESTFNLIGVPEGVDGSRAIVAYLIDRAHEIEEDLLYNDVGGLAMLLGMIVELQRTKEQWNEDLFDAGRAIIREDYRTGELYGEYFEEGEEPEAEREPWQG
jgi:hypothetical protein